MASHNVVRPAGGRFASPFTDVGDIGGNPQERADMKRVMTMGAAILVGALGVAMHSNAAIQSDEARLASQYSTWLGGRSNAEAVINALRTGNSVTLVTQGPNNTKSIAGFTAQTTLTTAEIGSALSSAKS